MAPITRPATVVLAALLASGCASLSPRASEPELPVYRRLFVTMPSHAAGFGITALPVGFPRRETARVSSQDAVDRAYQALRVELVNAGFDVVPNDQGADAILELTMERIGGNGEAEEAFVVFRDGESGRIVVVFRARSRLEPRSVEELMGRIVETIQEMVAPGDGRVALSDG
jgi:hypothetical protein